MEMQDGDKASLVVTTSPSFAISARTTMNVVQSMINDAEWNILITGYSPVIVFFRFDKYNCSEKSAWCFCEIFCKRYRQAAGV